MTEENLSEYEKKLKDEYIEEISIDNLTSDEYIYRAKSRAKRRKSPWNLILIPLVLFGFGITLYILIQTMWQVHVLFHPEHADKFKDLWTGERDFINSLSFFAFIAPLCLASLPAGMMIANIIAWFIPPARRTFEQEAEGQKAQCSFKGSMDSLWKFLKLILPVCIIISLIGAYYLKQL